MVSPGAVTTRWVKVTDTAVGQAVVIVLRVDVEVVRRVVGVELVVGEAVEATRTIGSPFAMVTHMLPLPSAVTVAPFP
jgi:hypothetical protein